MSELASYGSQDALASTAPPAHLFGNVSDDWAAAEIWLGEVADNSRNSSRETLATYRFHLAKLRWYCEQITHLLPSRWTIPDVKAFRDFLSALPARAISARGARAGDRGYTPFRKQPSPSSQADIMRFARAMFTAFHGTGYLRVNPMILTRTPKPRRLDTSRSIAPDIYDLVLGVMARQRDEGQVAYQRHLRDRFVLVFLRETGLRASELVGSSMGAVYALSDPESRKTYWVVRVDEADAKGAKERSIPLTRVAMDALIAYRLGFGLPALPAPNEVQPIVLSPRTRPLSINARAVKGAADRRFFGAWGSVTTRQGLYKIVKGRITDAAQVLQREGLHDAAAELLKASPHWLRHTFAKATLLHGHSVVDVAAALGHASVDTTMIYTEQGALDQIRAWERRRPGVLAEVDAVPIPAGAG